MKGTEKMKVVKVKDFTTVHKKCSDYFIGKDLDSLKMYLFRDIQENEKKWYLYDENPRFNRELMAVNLQEVSNFKQAENLVNGFWTVCKEFDSM